MKRMAIAAIIAASTGPINAHANNMFTPEFEIGVDLWESKGGLIWAHDASSACDCLGSKTSELDWKDIESTAMILEVKADFPFSGFVNFRLAGGSAEEGEIIDDDYFSKSFSQDLGIPERFSRTSSQVSDGGISFIELQAGYKHEFKYMNLNYASFFLGKSLWNEEYGAYGVNYLEDPLNNQSGLVIPYNYRVLSHEVSMDSFNIGVGLGIDLTSDLILEAEYQFIIDAEIKSKDTHHLRPDDFIKPTELDSSGDGYMAQLKLKYDINERVTAHLGYKILEIETKNGELTMHNPEGSRIFPLLHQNLERSGYTIGASYKF